MPFTRLRYHINWSTKRRRPTITPVVERVIHRAIAAEAVEMGGEVVVQNGWVEHHHLVVGFPPTICVSTAVARLKRASSAAVRRELKLKEFQWQVGYWAETLSPKRLRGICRYVERQKEHHGGGKVRWELEPVDD